MSKSANAGELRTKVYFKQVVHGTDDDAVTTEKEVNIFGTDESGNDIPVRVKWVNAHGTDAFTAMQLKLREPATLTMRYSPKIKPDLVVYKGSDNAPFEIISIDNVEERCRWLEIKVQRKVPSR